MENAIFYFVSTLCFIILTSVLMLKPASAETIDASVFDNYKLKIIEKGGYTEYIKGSDFDLSVDTDLRKITYSTEKLTNIINNLKCNNPAPLIKSQNARYEYEGNSYVIVKEIVGNEINKTALHNNIINAVNHGLDEINLEEKECYLKPALISDSDIMKSTLAVLNRYVSAKITYLYAGKTLCVDSSTIHNWLSVDGNNNVIINSAAVRGQVDYMANIYYNELGKSIPISGGRNGNNRSWSIDVDTESNALLNHIKYGQVLTKHPAYKQNSLGSFYNNISGDTFVEVDLTSQYLWFYKNGYVVANGSIVSGNLSASGCATPTGVYSIKAKQRDTKLIGPDYESPVSFWMPFIANSIGLHDASWRNTFGGEIYKTNGSHGCVNLPYSLAEKIYSNISIGTPVMVHY